MGILCQCGAPAREKFCSQRCANNAAARAYRARNRDKRKILCDAWRKNNPEKIKEMRKRSRSKRKSNPMLALQHRVSASVWNALKANKKGRSWEALVGYDLNKLKLHLESKFTEGMTWDKYLKGEIHLDHIKPTASFNFINPEDEGFKQCWALENLQPLWASDNRKKNDYIIHEGKRIRAGSLRKRD